MYKRILFPVVIYLTGCSYGSLQEDIQSYDAVFTPSKSSETLYINFRKLPGVIIEGHRALNCDPIAKDAAHAVFSKKFAQTELGLPGPEVADPYLILELRVEGASSYISGKHSSKVEGILQDGTNKVLFRAMAEHVVPDNQYLQKESMERAFYGSYQKILEEFEMRTITPKPSIGGMR